jgi:hypothetical protein
MDPYSFHNHRLPFDAKVEFVKVRTNELVFDGKTFAAGELIDLRKTPIEERLRLQLWDQFRLDMPSEAEVAAARKRK